MVNKLTDRAESPYLPESTTSKSPVSDQEEHFEESASVAQKIYGHYTGADLKQKIDLTNYIYSLKDSAKETAVAAKNMFSEEKEYIEKHGQQLTMPYDSKDPTLTPFVKTILDGHPFFARRMYQKIIKDDPEHGESILAQQLFDYWNEAGKGRGGYSTDESQKISAIVSECMPSLYQKFEGLFKVKRR